MEPKSDPAARVRVAEATPAAAGPITPAELLPLIGLAFGAFVFNTSEFMPIGLLTSIADDFAVSSSTVGLIITAYSWAVALFSLPLTMVSTRFEDKHLLLLVLGIFVAGQLVTVLSVNLLVLTLARILIASAHAVFWAIVSPMAVRVARPEHHTQALGAVVTGSSLAMVLGLPLGRVIGLAVGWRSTFLIVACVGAAILVYCLITVPKLPRHGRFSLKRLPVVLKNPALAGIYLLTVIFITGYFTGYSYIEPFLLQITGMPKGFITATLTGFGLAGISGSFLYMRLYDGHRAGFLRWAVGGVSAALLLMGLASISQITSVMVCLLWGVAAVSFNVAAQSEVIAAAEERDSAVAMSIYSGIYNVGIGAGSALGGVVVSAGALASIGYVGFVFAAAGYAVLVLFLLRHIAPARLH